MHALEHKAVGEDRIDDRVQLGRLECQVAVEEGPVRAQWLEREVPADLERRSECHALGTVNSVVVMRPTFSYVANG